MYGFSISIQGGVDDVVKRVAAALSNEGFGVLTRIDVHDVMKAKLQIDRRPYVILGACNPKLAHEAIERDADAGLLLPCNVVVRAEEDGSTTIAFMDPLEVMKLAHSEALTEVALEARARLERVRDSLQGSAHRAA